MLINQRQIKCLNSSFIWKMAQQHLVFHFIGPLQCVSSSEPEPQAFWEKPYTELRIASLKTCLCVQEGPFTSAESGWTGVARQQHAEMERNWWSESADRVFVVTGSEWDNTQPFHFCWLSHCMSHPGTQRPCHISEHRTTTTKGSFCSYQGQLFHKLVQNHHIAFDFWTCTLRTDLQNWSFL